MTDEYSDEELDFIRAVRANNYAHIELNENMALITDSTDEEQFQPFVSVEDDSLNERDVEEELTEFDWMDWENVEINSEDGINFDFCDVYGAEFFDPSGVENNE
jgi:hypothetical protein